MCVWEVHVSHHLTQGQSAPPIQTQQMKGFFTPILNLPTNAADQTKPNQTKLRKSPDLTSKTLLDSLLGPREEVERRNQKTTWPFCKALFKCPLGMVLSISAGGVPVSQTF